MTKDESIAHYLTRKRLLELSDEYAKTNDKSKKEAIAKNYSRLYSKLLEYEGEKPMENSINEYYDKGIKEIADAMPNECIGVVEVQQPDGEPIVIPQYKAPFHPWDKLFNEVTKALTRGGKEEGTFPRLAPKWECSEEECALRMVEFKIARIEAGKEKEDSYVDAIGYLVLAWQKYHKEQSK